MLRGGATRECKNKKHALLCQRTATCTPDESAINVRWPYSPGGQERRECFSKHIATKESALELFCPLYRLRAHLRASTGRDRGNHPGMICSTPCVMVWTEFDDIDRAPTTRQIAMQAHLSSPSLRRNAHTHTHTHTHTHININGSPTPLLELTTHLVDVTFPREERLSEQQLRKYAPKRPSIDRSRVVRRPKNELRRAVVS